MGTIKGMGKIYLQSIVDADCSLGFGKLYLSKAPMAAVDVLLEASQSWKQLGRRFTTCRNGGDHNP